MNFLQTSSDSPARPLIRVWPFFLVLSIVILGTGIWVVSLNPQLQRPEKLIPFAFLIVAHVILHWLSPLISNHPRWIPTYLGFQGALAFVLVYFSASSMLAYPVYMALVGETVGIFRNNWQRVAAVLAYLGLSVINMQLLQEPGALNIWFTVVVPMTIFVVVYVVLYSREAIARAEAQVLLQELEAANHQLAEYAGRIEQLERQRMARELHDTLAQGLAGLILQLEAVDSHMVSGRNERAQEIVQQAMERARVTLADARRAIENLRSESSQVGDLESIVQAEVKRFSSAAGIPCTLEIALPVHIPAPICEHAVRFVAEGLTNIARHAQAGRAWVRISHIDANLNIEVGDDGAGFDAAASSTAPGHYGLLGMRERARLAGGSFRVESRPGHGATIHLALPLEG